MINFFTIRQFKFPFLFLTVLFALVFIQARKPKKAVWKPDPNTIEIKGGAFYLGASDEEVDMAMNWCPFLVFGWTEQKLPMRNIDHL
jgi:hypothetical protein